MLKLTELSSFFERCIDFSKKEKCIPCGPIIFLYKEKDQELLTYLRQNCDKDELYELIKRCVDDLNNKPMTLMGIKNGYLSPEEYPSRNFDLRTWLNDWNYLYEQALDQSDKKYVLSLFFLCEGFNKYCADVNEKEFLEETTLISIYGESLKSNYNLIPVDDSIELLELFPARIYDKNRNITIFVEIDKNLLCVLNRLTREGVARRISIRGKGKKVFDGRYTEQVLCEAVEKGSIFSFSKLFSVPDVTKLYSYEYGNQLWISSNHNELTFEELNEDITVQADGVRTQMVHILYSNCENKVLINHIDHEYIYYTIDEYEERLLDSRMKTKGSAHRRIKTFKVDDAEIPWDYPCKMRQLNQAKNTYEEMDVPFLYFVINNFFNNKDLLEEYFAKII